MTQRTDLGLLSIDPAGLQRPPGLLGMPVDTLRAAFTLLGARGSKGLGGAIGDFSNAMLAGMDAYDQRQVRNQGLLAAGLRNQMEMEQLEQMRGQQAEDKQIRGLLGQFKTPGVVPATPNDDEGNPMPMVSAPSFNWNGYANAVSQINPMRGLQLQSQLAGMNQKERVKLGRGESLVDPNTGRMLAQGTPDLPTGMVMGPNGPQYVPSYLQGQKDIRSAGRQQTTVNLPPAQKAFEVELAKLDAKQLDDFRDTAVKAQDGIARISEMKRLAQDGTYSGWGATGRAGVANFFSTLGVPFDQAKLENSQQYTKHAKELTLAMLKAGVGASNISNADLQFVNDTVPQLETNPAARMQLLEYMEGRLGQSVERFDRADSYARERGGLSGFKYQTAPTKVQPRLEKNSTAIFKAQQAIKSGKSREAVRQHLIDNGFDPGGL